MLASILHSFWLRLVSLSKRKSNLFFLSLFAVWFGGIFVLKQYAEVSVHTQAILWEMIKPYLPWLFIKAPQMSLHNYRLYFSAQLNSIGFSPIIPELTGLLYPTLDFYWRHHTWDWHYWVWKKRRNSRLEDLRIESGLFHLSFSSFSSALPSLRTPSDSGKRNCSHKKVNKKVHRHPVLYSIWFKYYVTHTRVCARARAHPLTPK